MSLTINKDHLSPIISRAEAIGHVDRNADFIFTTDLVSINNFTTFTSDLIAKIINKMRQFNQTVLITGGASGIGLTLAKKFLANDNTVIITGRNLSKLEKVKKENPTIHIFQSDVTDDREVRQLSNNILEKFNGLDVLINNAGIMNLVDTGKEDNDLH
jgi:NADPH:quinone reductase-like Zn-dependent oxidoreductase